VLWLNGIYFAALTNLWQAKHVGDISKFYYIEILRCFDIYLMIRAVSYCYGVDIKEVCTMNIINVNKSNLAFMNDLNKSIIYC
jgi:hypothetical protein